MKTTLKNQLFKAINIDRTQQSVKMTEAPLIKGKEKGKFAVPKYGILQADLIYMKAGDEKGFKYILTVVDVATRKMDAIPLRGREGYDVIEGFEQIWKHKYLTKDGIDSIYTDSGSEFKNKDFKEYMADLGIDTFTTMTARHQQMGIVEYTNHLITQALYTKMTSEELVSGEPNSEWVELLPILVKTLNAEDNQKVTKIKTLFAPPRTTNAELDARLAIGTVVHVRLQQPQDHMKDKNNRLHGGFRNGDIRWEKDVTEIVNIVVSPNQPIRYLVKKYNNVSFIRKELLLASESEIANYKNITNQNIKTKK